MWICVGGELIAEKKLAASRYTTDNFRSACSVAVVGEQ